MKKSLNHDLYNNETLRDSHPAVLYKTPAKNTQLRLTESTKM